MTLTHVSVMRDFVSMIIDPHACVFDACMMPISMMRLKFCDERTDGQGDSRSWIQRYCDQWCALGKRHCLNLHSIVKYQLQTCRAAKLTYLDQLVSASYNSVARQRRSSFGQICKSLKKHANFSKN